jgi:ABC-type transport system substrate-binding protein
MSEQVAAQDPTRRRALFTDVQRIFADELPIIYFAAPRIFMATSARVVGVTPAPIEPELLWNADVIGVTGPAHR